MVHPSDLHGHFLTNLPRRVWEFSRAPLSTDARPEEERFASKDSLFYYHVIYQSKVRYLSQRECIFYRPAEWVVRRVFCSIGAVFLAVTALPIGFFIKIGHRGILALQSKASHAWADETLLGHALTKTAFSCYQFATGSLNWHLLEGGKDRRTSEFKWDPQKGGMIQVKRGEYTFVPFELIEFIARRGFGSALVAFTFPLAITGLVSKTIHNQWKQFVFQKPTTLENP